MKVRLSPATCHSCGKYELPDFEEAFNFEDLKRFYDRQSSSVPEFIANSSDDLDLFLVDDSQSKSQDCKDLITSLGMIDQDRTRPSTPVDRSPQISRHEPMLKLLESKMLIPDQNDMIGGCDNTDLSYLTGYWQNIDQEINDKRCLQKVDYELDDNVKDVEKKEMIQDDCTVNEVKPLAKDKKKIFTIIRNNKVKKLNEVPVVKKDKKSKKIHKIKKNMQNPPKQNHLN